MELAQSVEGVAVVELMRVAVDNQCGGT